jgi:hypothetical protein
MPNQISALEHRASDFIREVSLDALNFYTDGLIGLYLPDDFKHANADVFDVKYWKVEDRLVGKFGYFALKHLDDEQAKLEDILVMGTTIGLHGLDNSGDMESLRHFSLRDGLLSVLKARDLVGEPIRAEAVDYGDTLIKLSEDGTPQSVSIGGTSFDFGRAGTEGRQRTCELFEQLLGQGIDVINSEPEPKERQRIIA